MSMDNFLSMLTPEQKLAFIKALQEDTGSSTNEPQEKTKTDTKDSFIMDTKQPTNNRRKEPVKARKNEWVDTGEGRDFDTEYGERSPRIRKPYKKVNVECSVCGKSFKADPKYIYGEYHRCSRCVGR